MAYIVSRAASLSIPWNLSIHNAVIGGFLALPPLALNELLWRRANTKHNSVYARFSREIIVPLCRQMSTFTAVIIATLSGSCEELFFRGMLHALSIRYLDLVTTCFVTSFLFAAMHFVGNFRRYGGMIPLYTLMGAYLWAVYVLSGSLLCAAVAHGLYNFSAIMRVKRYR